MDKCTPDLTYLTPALNLKQVSLEIQLAEGEVGKKTNGDEQARSLVSKKGF